MKRFYWTRSVGFSLILAWVLGPSLGNVAYGQLEQTSVAKLTSDVDLYVGIFRLQEQWQHLAQSPTFRQLRDSRLYAAIESEFMTAWSERRGAMSRLRAVLENRNTQEALRFVEDVISKDFFFAADGTLSDFLRRSAQVQRRVHLLSDPSISDEEKADLIYQWIDELGPDWKLPTLVLGGAISDNERALSKVDEVEGLLRLGLGARPELKEALKYLKRIEDGRGSRIQWILPLANLPWDSIPTNEIFDSESLDRLREVLSDKNIVITVGILDGRFILSLSGNPDPLPAVDFEKSLFQHPHLGLVREHQDRSVTGIRYVSDPLAQATFDLNLRDFFSKFANSFVRPNTYDMPDSDYKEWLLTCLDDAGWVDSAIEAHVPAARGLTEVQFITDDGWESQLHQRSVDVVFDGSKPLRGLQFFGAEPLVVLNVRLANHPEYFATARSIVRRIKSRLDDLTEVDSDDLPDPRWKELAELVHSAWPTVTRATDLWQQQILPTMNGEHVFVLHSGNVTSQQWHPKLPVSDVPLPIPEVSILTGIRDREAWIQAIRNARDLTQQTLNAVSASATAPQIPIPQRTDSNGLTTWGFPIPDDCPAPKSMMPRLIVGNDWSLITYSDSQAREMMASSEPSIGLSLFRTDLPAAKAAWIDLGGLAKIETPWIDYALKQFKSALEDPTVITVFDTAFTINLQAEDILNAWRCLEVSGQMASWTTAQGDGSSLTRAMYRW
ncbi:MAG: hypothetical protein MUF23_16365 [Pirellula sp.]|nr:hypothetical protein [Pirellula sp.]